MGTNAPRGRKAEVTRSVRLAAPSADSPDSSPNQLISWTGQIEELLGYPLADVGNTEAWWLEKIHEDDRQRVENSYHEKLKPGLADRFAAESRIWGYDYRFRKADGSYVLVSDRSFAARDRHGNVTQLSSILFDKENRKYEREAHVKDLESHNHLALIANNTQSAIYMMDPQGYCLFMNAAAEAITGFTFQEIYDFTFHAACHSCRPNGDLYPIEECPVYLHQQNGTIAKSEPERFVHKDGHYYDIEFSVSPIGDYVSGGAIIEFRDVTEQKQIEKERMNALLMTEQQSMQIKADEIHKTNMTSFVSFICHELRNPLQGVTSSAEFLLDTLQKLDALASKLPHVEQDTDDDGGIATATGNLALTFTPAAKVNQPSERPTSLARSHRASSSQDLVEMQGLVSYAKQLVANIQTCAEHQALITDNVLDLSRIDAGKLQPTFDVIDVRVLGQQTVQMMSSKAKRKGITLSLTEGDGGPLYLKVDTTIFRQVLLNLISNAIKFTLEHGPIAVEITADPPDVDGLVVLHTAVADNGLGMTEAEQKVLFQRFSQANRKVAQLYGGSGLGLSISKELVHVMGGEMHVTSSKGVGSTFSFTSLHDLPTKHEVVDFLRQSNYGKDGLPADPIVDNAEPAPKFRMIGFAEDNPINRQHLARHLKILGYAYVLGTNGKEILDKVCEEGSTIDCCIIDMSMPVMDGLEAAQRIRKFEVTAGREPMPIIALSGNALKEQVTDALSAGISDYLVKPAKQADLARRLEYWEQVVHTGAAFTPMGP